MAIVVLTTMTVGGAMLLSPGGATAAPCDKPTETGNASASVAGVGGFGVDQNNVGTTQQDVIVCVEPGGGSGFEVQVDVTDRPGHGGEVAVTTCDRYSTSLATCSSRLRSTGAEVTPPGTVVVPSPAVNPPADGNGSVGANTGTGSLACIWVDGTSRCGSATVATGPPNGGPNPGALADHMVAGVLGAEGFVDLCWYLTLQTGDAINGGLGCALITASYFVTDPASMVAGWIG